MVWTGEHGGFVVEAYYENNRSVIATQRAFRTRFALGQNAHVIFSFGDTLRKMFSNIVLDLLRI
jgi:hypothetical protein